MGLGGLAYAVAASAEAGSAPSFPVLERASVRSDSEGAVHIAGSGSNLPITRALVAAYEATHPSARFVLHESIGSTGGVRAVRDGAIDVGLVSRALRPGERDTSLRVVPYARVPVVFVTRADASDGAVPRGLSRDDVLAIFEGRQTRWASGTPIILFLRERGDSGQEAVASALRGFADASAMATTSGRHRVLYHDADLARAVASVGGGLGVSDLARARESGLRALELDGVVPGPDTLRSGGYPFAKELAFVIRPPVSALATDFIEFAHSAPAREIIERYGALPREP